MSTDDPTSDENLARQLKVLFPAPAIPTEVERQILSMPSRHLATQRRKRTLRWALWGTTGAIAASVALAAWVGLHRTAGESRPAPQLAAVTDIRDAFYLARQLKAGIHDPAWDVNHDHVVDQRDVDALANAAVTLKRTSP